MSYEEVKVRGERERQGGRERERENITWRIIVNAIYAISEFKY